MVALVPYNEVIFFAASLQSFHLIFAFFNFIFMSGFVSVAT